jgi:glycosyltransferase involved in cell wall biosynthesis
MGLIAQGGGRIILLCQHFHPEMISTGMHMTELSLALKKLGWDITVCCAQPSLSVEGNNETAPREMELKGIRVARVPAIGSHSKTLIFRALFGMTFLLACAAFVIRNRRDFDGILITTNPPFLGLVGRMASMLMAKPYVMIVYDVYPDIPIRLDLIRPASLTSFLWERVSCSILRGAVCNVVIGRDMEKVIAGKLGPLYRDKISVIPNWSDEDVVFPVPRDKNEFRKEHCVEDLILVQYSGRMARTHNLEPLVGAAELMRDDPVCFQFIGDGAKKRTLQEMASARRLTNIQFLP